MTDKFIVTISEADDNDYYFVQVSVEYADLMRLMDIFLPTHIIKIKQIKEL